MVRIALTLSALVNAATVPAWTWPSPQLERLDALRFDQQPPPFAIPNDISNMGNPREKNDLLRGKGGNELTNSADWLRTSFHDMSPFNITEGTGGLDASIQFAEELARPQNAGDDFINTIKNIRTFTGRYVSTADGLALSAVLGVERCGGPQIAYRGGRIDATKANKPGVPDPFDSLPSLKATFARQGLTPTEMIQLVACGHTMGGVQRKLFPTIVKDQDDVHFDQTVGVFDNHVATEYVAGTTQNPLVVTPNTTMRSDLRIFSSDKNVTIKDMASSASNFASTCSRIIAKMIDSVPKEVKLTEVLSPPSAKPDSITLVHNPDGSSSLFGRVRFWNMAEDSKRVVNLVWSSKNATTKCSGCSLKLTHDPDSDFSVYVPGGLINPFYNFAAPGAKINATLAGSDPKFWFEVVQGGTTTKFDQAGKGFQLQTQVLVAKSTCLDGDSLNVDIAVRKGSSPSKVFVRGDTTLNDDFAPSVSTTFAATLDSAASAKDKVYDIYSVTIPNGSKNLDRNLLNVAATIGGKEVADWTYFGPATAVWGQMANGLGKC